MKYNGENLKEVLEAHKRWLDESEGLSETDKADLRGANLCKANLRGANLCKANLRGADLREADLFGADLRGADLRGAYLRGAYLCEADLRGAYLRGAYLRGAYLCEADLCEADLCGADLVGADLRGAKNAPFIPMACPDTGSFIGWKKCQRAADKTDVIVKLLIPDDAKRSSATDRKCRADKAQVLEIQTLDGEKLDVSVVYSAHDCTFAYEVGKTVTPTEPFCEDRWVECASGIHFFINRQEAVDY